MSRDEEKKAEEQDAEDTLEDTLEEPVIGEDEEAGNEEDVASDRRYDPDDQDAEDEGEDTMLTTQDDPDQGKALRKPDPESESKPEETPNDPVMEVGRDIPTLPGPGTLVINRAAIVYLAKHMLAPPDLEDFKTAFPSMF